MNPHTSYNAQPYKCPPQDRALFDGTFSGHLRELVVGSSRRDALSAIHTSKLTDWVVEDTTASLERPGISLVFNRRAPSASHWVTGSTPHGEFSLPREHWIAKQLHTRFDRRTKGFRADLFPVALEIADQMFMETLTHERRTWKILPKNTFGAMPMKPTEEDPAYGTRNFVKRTEAATDLGNGFYAALMNLTYFGVRTEGQAVNDYIRYTADTALTGKPGLISAPKPAGEYADEYIFLSVHYQPLERLRSIVGLGSDPLYTTGMTSDRDRVKAIWLNSGLK